MLKGLVSGGLVATILFGAMTFHQPQAQPSTPHTSASTELLEKLEERAEKYKTSTEEFAMNVKKLSEAVDNL